MTTSAARELIVGARRASGLSQAELARRASMPRSVLNAYERGTRDPGAAALDRIVAAAGRDLVTTPAPTVIDPARAARVLEQVLDLAELLPFRRHGRLAPSPLRRSPR